MTLCIEGGVAVITGAASGIGSGLARHAAGLGMRLVLADVQEAGLRDFAASLPGEVLALATDVSSAESVERLAQAAYQHFGAVDLLFNNAGVLSTGYSWEIEPARWKRDFDVNVHGVLNGLRSFVPRLLRAGRPAHIVNTASVGGFLPSPLMAPYSASKFAVVALSESLRGELEMLGAPIGVSLLAPGPVRTGIFDDPFGGREEPAARAFVDHMRALLKQHGLGPEPFAERVFAGLREGRYWLIPQPEALDAPLQQRHEDLMARRTPRLPW
jgi:NAD(P)-dependent dehydrogenase (short-subunit alcohol dehydrogenase family)